MITVAVHPHACGEHSPCSFVAIRQTGSSPRMWGTPAPSVLPGGGGRFIPTHVGNTFHPQYRRVNRPVHPHACGEHGYLGQATVDYDGSSPRMWGTRRLWPRAAQNSRFIPTHVGNTYHMVKGEIQCSVHPHACGEHMFAHDWFLLVVGSSPRMWGTPPVPLIGDTSNRFIPTHVGNTYFSQRINCDYSVHPHACGEHVIMHCGNTMYYGSSPRMWGTHIPDHTIPHYHRFIPTHVGNTCRPHVRGVLAAVHPHACGEHPACPRPSPGMAGSSPRMWGTLNL